MEEESTGRELIGVVIFDGEKFLLLHRILNWTGWEYVKGGIDEGESPEEAIKRELFEETGISKYDLIGVLDNFIFFDSVRKANSHLTNFLVRVPNTAKITFTNQETNGDGERAIEHDKFKWVFPKDAIEALTHQNQKDTLKKAIELLGIEVE